MLYLIPEKINFQISCVDLELIYTENKTSLKIEGYDFDNYLKSTITELEIVFEKVAEIKCITLNFFEFNYSNYKIIDLDDNTNKLEFWKENGYPPNSRFYKIDNSEYLKNVQSIYDPKNTLDLKHFLVVGYDSYIELIASNYKV